MNIDDMIKEIHYEKHRTDLSEIIISKSLNITQNLKSRFLYENYSDILKSIFKIPQIRYTLAAIAVAFFALGIEIHQLNQNHPLLENTYYLFGDIL